MNEFREAVVHALQAKVSARIAKEAPAFVDDFRQIVEQMQADGHAPEQIAAYLLSLRGTHREPLRTAPIDKLGKILIPASSEGSEIVRGSMPAKVGSVTQLGHVEMPASDVDFAGTYTFEQTQSDGVYIWSGARARRVDDLAVFDLEGGKNGTLAFVPGASK